MLKHLKIAGLIFSLGLVFLFFGFTENKTLFYKMSKGSYFFTKTRDCPQVKSVVLTFPDNQKISIEQQDDLWRIKELDDYYASFNKINTLVALIRNTTVYRSDKLTNDVASPVAKKPNIVIESFNANGELIDKGEIYARLPHNKYHYALLNNDGLLYQIIGDFSLSSAVTDWAQMPLLAVERKQIERIKSDDFEVYRRFNTEEFKSIATKEPAAHIRGLIENLWYLSAQDVRHALHFDLTKYQKNRHYEIWLFGGAIYDLDIFNNGTEYWLNIRLKAGKIVNASTARQLKENSILYDGWFFRIDKNKGEAISGFML